MLCPGMEYGRDSARNLRHSSRHWRWSQRDDSDSTHRTGSLGSGCTNASAELRSEEVNRDDEAARSLKVVLYGELTRILNPFDHKVEGISIDGVMCFMFHD